MVRDFVSSFKYPTYKWYWIWLAVNAFSGMVESSFQYFWLQVRLLQSICTARRSHTVIMGQWVLCIQLRWLQDCFPSGYCFFGIEIASNVKSAISVQGALHAVWSGSHPPTYRASSGILTTVLTVVFVAMVQPHIWREKLGGRQVILWTQLLFYFVRPFSFALLQDNFTIVLLWTVWQALMSSIAVAAAWAAAWRFCAFYFNLRASKLCWVGIA
jgi:hypothetical protein